MLSTSESVSGAANRASKISRNGLQGTEMDFSVHIRAARGIWPRKTAEQWAAAAGTTPRMASYWLAGTHPVSSDGILALIRVLN